MDSSFSPQTPSSNSFFPEEKPISIEGPAPLPDARFMPGHPPVIVYFPGFFSYMRATKATRLAAACRERGQAYLRFDYRGHGKDEDHFDSYVVSDWLEDAIRVCEQAREEGPVLAVGSSMGGWLALLAALSRKELISGIIGLATAADMTERIYHHRLTPDQHSKLTLHGAIRVSSPYRDEPLVLTRRLFEDGRQLSLGVPGVGDGSARKLHRSLSSLDVPVWLIHGKRDEDIPWQTSDALHKALGPERSTLELISDGGHRLSEEPQLQRIIEATAKMSV